MTFSMRRSGRRPSAPSTWTGSSPPVVAAPGDAACSWWAPPSAPAAVTAVVALALTAAGGPPTTPSTPAGAQPAAQPSAPSGAAPIHAGETPDQTRQRLAAALADGLATAVPGVVLSDGPTGRAGVSIFVNDARGRYESDTVLTTADGESELFFVSWRGGSEPALQTPAGWPSGRAVPVLWFESCSEVPTNDAFTGEGYRLVTECEESVGAEGQTIVVTSETCVDCPGRPTVRRDAYVTWTNARVSVGIVNDTKRSAPGTTRAALLLTKEQLVAIARDPELTVAA